MADGVQLPTGIQVGLGTRAAATTKIGTSAATGIDDISPFRRLQKYRNALTPGELRPQSTADS